MHPKALENIGRMSAQQADRFFYYWPIELPRAEIDRIITEAGCEVSEESWKPYRENIRSPLLIYDD